MGKSKILYDGKLDQKNGIIIDMDIGNIEIREGLPYLLATTKNWGGSAKLSNSNDVQNITANKCSLEITYPNNKNLEIKMNTGSIMLKDISPKNLDVFLRRGNLEVDLKNTNMDRSKLSVDHGRIVGFLQYDLKKDSEILVQLLEGITELRFSIPKGSGITTIMKNSFTGILDISKDINGQPNLKVNVNANRGILKIKH